MTTKTFQYDIYSITISLNNDKIYMKMLDTNNLYENEFDSFDLKLIYKLSNIYTLICKELEQKNLKICINNDSIKLEFYIIIEELIEINFDVLLKKNIYQIVEKLEKSDKENKFDIKKSFEYNAVLNICLVERLPR